MKSIHVIALTLLFFSCSGTKKTIESQPNQTKVTSVDVEKSDVLEVLESTKNDDISSKKDEISHIENDYQKPDNSIKEAKSDSLKFGQELSKRFYENHDLWHELLNKNVSVIGKVNYDGFKKSQKDLSIYINMLKMAYSEIEKFSKEKKLAYWINAYNALTIDLILRNYPLNSIKDIKDPWDQRLWQFGDKWLNLNDIEHKVLRKMNEPRIHFAIVCASESCPKLLNEAFTADKLDVQLTNATKVFLSDTSKNEISENNIKLSKIFKWFAKDFKTNGNLINFLNQYSEVTISSKAKKSFKDYDWSLNN